MQLFNFTFFSLNNNTELVTRMDTLKISPVQEVKFLIGEDEHAIRTDSLDPNTSLNEYLRNYAHLTATKKMCLEGGCGSCIVAVEEIHPISQKVHMFSVNSCLVPIFLCHGWKIHTNEGIGGPTTKYHPIQDILANGNGSQCGFCSSGMVMNMYSLFESGSLTQQEIEDSFGGNICRCTGYRPILEAFRSLATDIEDYIPCYKRECKKNCKKNETPFWFQLGESKWIKVYNINDLLGVLTSIGQKSYQLIAGNTAKGVYKSTKVQDVYIDISKVKELTRFSIQDNKLILGANMSLNMVIECCSTVAESNSKFSYLNQIVTHLKLVANVPVRNIGTLAGNLMIKYFHNEFPSDIFLLLEALDATLVIVDLLQNEIRTSPNDFLKIDMHNRVIKNVILTELDDSYKFGSYKIMPKAQNSHAMVNAAFLFQLNESTIKSVRIVYGAISSNFVHAVKTEKFLNQKKLFDNNILQQAYATLDAEIEPTASPPDSKPEFRKQLAISLFYKFVLSIAPSNIVSSRHRSGGGLLERPISHGHQEYGTDSTKYPVSKPTIKVEALAQTTGQAEYIDDIPDRPNQLHAAFVLANAKPFSKIIKVDASIALKQKNVIGFFDKDSIPGENSFTPKLGNFPVTEEVFCSGTVQYHSQPIGIIVATSHEAAENATNLVKVSYQLSNQKPLFNIKDVLKANARDRITALTTVDRKKKGNNTKHVIKGDFYVGSQYHMYMEVQCCNVVPTEDGLDIYAATQWMDATHLAAAAVLNIPTNKINVIVRRLGGGFGGKMTRNSLLTNAAAVAAYKLKKPVKIWMPLEKNMRVIGKRFPLYVEYEVGVDEFGVFQYFDAQLYTDYGVGGNEPVDPYLINLFKHYYNTDTWKFTTNSVRTDMHPYSYMRGPGTSEGLASIQSIMEHIAYTLKLEPWGVINANINNEEFSRIHDFMADMNDWANIAKRKQAVIEFNKDNRWRKRGLSIVPMAWTLHVEGGYIAMVSIFRGDGGVAVIHGGIECGQGINTKVAQACAYRLQIPMEKVSVKPNYDVVTPNAAWTGGSLTSEAVCYAVIKACDVLLERMKPIKEKMKNPTWEELVNSCFEEHVQLSASSMYSPNEPGIQNYLIYGCCATEVELDILTGKHEILRVDLIEDTGDSINPLLDVGQVEGAFVIGMGYHTPENVITSDEGEILTNRTWNYYVPGPKDIPINLNIKFPTNNPNPLGVLKSKAIAEPPLCLAVSVPFAIRNAVASARSDANSAMPSWFKFDGCTNVENVYLNSLNDYKQYQL